MCIRATLGNYSLSRFKLIAQFPKVIIEVLSQSTELYDRTTKFELYKQIQSLEDYVLT